MTSSAFGLNHSWAVLSETSYFKNGYRKIQMLHSGYGLVYQPCFVSIHLSETDRKVVEMLVHVTGMLFLG